MTTGRLACATALVVAFFLGISAPDLLAQAAGGGDVSAPAAAKMVAGDTVGTDVEGMSWQQIVESGGWIIWVLVVMSILTVAFVIYFFVVLRDSQVVPARLERDLKEKIKAGGVEDARKTCEQEPCSLSAVVTDAIEYIRNVPSVDPSLLKEVMEAAGGRQADAIQGQTQYLLDIAVIAPMVGLLGTVFGMLKAFSAVALNIANAKPVVLAQGVSQALVTTAFGLIVGIPAMIFYAYFRRRSATLVSHLEAASTDILTALLGNR